MYEMSPITRREHEEDEDYRHDYRRNYRDDEDRYDYRYDYRRGRENYRGDYRRGRKNYRNYREEDYYEELEMCMEDAKEDSRKYEDLADMASNQHDKNNLMKISQREKEHYTTLKEMIDR